MNLQNQQYDGFFLWLTEHEDVRPYLLIDSLFLPKGKKDLAQILQLREQSHEDILSRITAFFHTHLVNASPHEPIMYSISKYYIPQNQSFQVKINHILTVKRHKMYLSVFNRAIKLCSELITLFSNPDLIPQNIQVHIKEEFFDSLLTLPDCAVKLDKYMSLHRTDSLRIINSCIDFTAQKNILSLIVANTMPMFNNTLSYFPENSIQNMFNRFLFSPLNQCVEDIKELVNSYQSKPRQQFTKNINKLFQILVEKYKITEKQHIKIIYIYFTRALYEHCANKNYNYFFDQQEKLINPKFFDQQLESEIKVPDTIKLDNIHISIRDFVNQHPQLINSSLNLLSSSFYVCPLDVIYEIHIALNCVCNCFTEVGLLDFDSAFSFFYMSILYSGNPLFISTVEFVENFVSLDSLCGDFSSAYMMMAAAKSQLIQAVTNMNCFV